MVAYTYNLSTWAAKAGDLPRIHGKPGLQSETLSQKGLKAFILERKIPKN